MAEYRECLYYRYQCWHFDSVAGVLAVRGLQHSFHNIQIRSTREGPPYLESFQFWHFGDVVSGSGDGSQFEHSVGQLPFAHGGYLGTGLGDYLAIEAIPHQRYLCSVLPGVCFFAKLADRQSVASGNRTDYGADVSAFYFLHDYRSEDDRAFKNRAMRHGISRGLAGNGAALVSSCLRAVLRAFSRGALGYVD